MNKKLTEHVILITGAGGGLGSTAAMALALQGAQVILLDKNIPKMEKTYDDILANNGEEPIMYPFDLAGANENEYQELADTVEREFGALQGLLHSAVELSAFSPTINIKTQEWGHALNVNLNAPFLLTRMLLPVMQKSQQASIVFTSDSFARSGPAYAGAYGVSKIALEGFADILAQELESSHKIRVNKLVPGAVDSPLRQKLFPAEDKSKLAPMSSLSKVYTYLFSSDSLGVTGQTIEAENFNCN